MPAVSSETFITRMKLRELQAQRDQLHNTYSLLEQQTAEALDDSRRVRILYDGLRALTFAGEPFHPDIVNLDLLLHDISINQAAPATIQFWRERLARELERGRLRADAVYLFGALLDEWATHRSNLPYAPQQAVVQAELIEAIQQPPIAGDYQTFLNELLDSIGSSTLIQDQVLHTHIAESIEARVETEEVRHVLHQLRQEPSRSATIREEAQRALDSELLLKEFADALTILISQRTGWTWPSEGIPVHAYWSRTKWRLFLDDDLPTACFLEVLGLRWRTVFESILGDRARRHQARLERLEELNAPEIILENERRLLAATNGIHTTLVHDIWDTTLPEQQEPSWERSSIFAQRIKALQELRKAWERESYGGGVYATAMPQALALINAEISLGRTAFPNQQPTIVKVDLQSYYPSLSHELILTILKNMGMPEAELAFFAHYLAVPMLADNEVVVAQRGLPQKRQLSDVLGEVVLRLLEQHIQRSAQTLIVRVMDDICLITASPDEALRAWNAITSFCTVCGLEPNLAKCGAVTIGREPPESLPQGPVTWQFLALDREGSWHVHQPAFEAFLKQARWRISQASALLSKIELYNQQLALLTQMLALPTVLGPEHRRSIDAALVRYRREVFGIDNTVIDSLGNELRMRFLDSAKDQLMAEAWFYWPMTAGGLGLLQPTLLAHPYAHSLEQQRPHPPTLPHQKDWQRKANIWASFYGSLLTMIEPLAAEEHAVMETLVNDFIERGAELSSGKQQELSIYWRWVLYTYGPQILDYFGTFRFLETALVPQQLIVQRSLGDTEASVLLRIAPAEEIVS